MWVAHIQVSLKLSIGQFVGWLVLPILLMVLLDCIVGQEDEPIAQFTGIISLTGGSDIALLKPIALYDPVY